MKLRVTILWLVAVLILGFVNYAIFQKETLIAGGESIFLELAPVDPRSLIQGDYMLLRYDIASDLNIDNIPLRGKLVVERANDGIASFVRIDDGTPLSADQRVINYAVRDFSIDIGAGSFFFQEGTADQYDEARYAELKLASSGETVLIGLRGEALAVLGGTAKQE